MLGLTLPCGCWTAIVHVWLAWIHGCCSLMPSLPLYHASDSDVPMLPTNDMHRAWRASLQQPGSAKFSFAVSIESCWLGGCLDHCLVQVWVCNTALLQPEGRGDGFCLQSLSWPCDNSSEQKSHATNKIVPHINSVAHLASSSELFYKQCLLFVL